MVGSKFLTKLIASAAFVFAIFTMEGILALLVMIAAVGIFILG